MKQSICVSSVILALLVATPALADKGRKHERFAKLDLDGDGQISKQEFNQHHDEMFLKIDKNADGALSKDEMRAMIKDRRKQHAERMKNRHDS